MQYALCAERSRIRQARSIFRRCLRVDELPTDYNVSKVIKQAKRSFPIQRVEAHDNHLVIHSYSPGHIAHYLKKYGQTISSDGKEFPVVPVLPSSPLSALQVARLVSEGADRTILVGIRNVDVNNLKIERIEKYVSQFGPIECISPPYNAPHGLTGIAVTYMDVDRAVECKANSGLKATYQSWARLFPGRRRLKLSNVPDNLSHNYWELKAELATTDSPSKGEHLLYLRCDIGRKECHIEFKRPAHLKIFTDMITADPALSTLKMEVLDCEALTKNISAAIAAGAGRSLRLRLTKDIDTKILRRDIHSHLGEMDVQIRRDGEEVFAILTPDGIHDAAHLICNLATGYHSAPWLEGCTVNFLRFPGMNKLAPVPVAASVLKEKGSEQWIQACLADIQVAALKSVWRR